MIKTAVFSLWTKPQQTAAEFDNHIPTSGYPDLECLLNSAALSVRQARKHFDEVRFYTDNAGKAMLCDECGIFKEEEVTTLFETYEDFMPMMDIHKDLWSYGKLAVYSQMEVPFAHIDLDAYLFAPLRPKADSARIIAQGLESADWRLYNTSRAYFKENDFILPAEYHRYEANVREKIAYNCGIFGGNDLELIKELADGALKVFRDNYDKIILQDPSMMSDFNVSIEQYIPTTVLHSKGIRPELIMKNNYDPREWKNKCFGWLHFFGEAKFKRSNNNAIRNALRSRPFSKFANEPVVQDWVAMIDRLA